MPSERDDRPTSLTSFTTATGINAMTGLPTRGGGRGRKKRSTFSFRIFRLNVGTLLVLGVTLSALFVREQSRQAREALDHQGEILVRSLASEARGALLAADPEGLLPALQAALEDKKNVQYAVLYDGEGRALTSRTIDGSLQPPIGWESLPAGAQAILKQRMLPAGWDEAEGPEPLVTHFPRQPVEGWPYAGEDFYYPLTHPAPSAGVPPRRELIGIARVGVTRSSLDEAWERAIRLAVTTLALSMVLGTLLSLELSRRLAAPLKHLAQGARALGAGRLEERVEIETRDEVGELAKAFNRMAANLQEVYAGLEQKVAQRTAQLSEEKHHLEAVLNTVDEGVIMLDADGILVMVNRKFLELTDLDRTQVIGKHFTELIGVLGPRISDLPAMHERTRFLITHPRERAVDMFEIIHPERKVLHRFSAPVWDYDSGDVQRGLLGRIEVYRDITRETEIDRMKSEFISTVSHELRTPLTSIKGSLGLILGGAAGELAPEAAELLQIAQNNSERLIRLINDILDISKIESGKMKLKLAEFDLTEVVKEAVQGVAAFAQKCEVKVVTRVAAGGMPATADRDRILQILTNLLSNAIKFSRKGGVVTVAVGRELAHGRYKFGVRDHGVGIPADQLPRLFQKFQQVEGTHAHQVGGSGLGLAICKALVQEHRGEIWAESELGKGSTFWFTLPAPESTAAEVLAADLVASRMAEQGSAPRVLIVDDDKDVANLIRMYLEQEGFECVTAEGGKQALELAKDDRFDAITLDLNMPGMSGFEVAKALKEDPGTQSTPVIFVSVSGAQEEADHPEAVGLSFADWVTKPIDPLRLVSAVKQHAGKRPGRPMILVVDDDPDIQKLLGIILSREGFEVDSARNGEEALKRVAARRPDLLILDLVMPQLDGFAVVKRLREQKQTRRIPILILTVKDISEDERRILQTGATKFLTKSYASREALLKEIVEMLQGALRGDMLTTGGGQKVPHEVLAAADPAVLGQVASEGKK